MSIVYGRVFLVGLGSYQSARFDREIEGAMKDDAEKVVRKMANP
jgi:hypothetical protein